MKTYSELIKINSLIDRYKYLKLNGKIGMHTFGGKRWLNQDFYRSSEWKQFRKNIIIRDNGCELGLSDWRISGPIYIHHINPITEKDIIHNTDNLLDENNVISCSFDMHQAIHFGDESLLFFEWVPRSPNDTIPWR